MSLKLPSTTCASLARLPSLESRSRVPATAASSASIERRETLAALSSASLWPPCPAVPAITTSPSCKLSISTASLSITLTCLRVSPEAPDFRSRTEAPSSRLSESFCTRTEVKERIIKVFCELFQRSSACKPANSAFLQHSQVAQRLRHLVCAFFVVVC